MQTYKRTIEITIAVEANNSEEALIEIGTIARSIAATLPVGAIIEWRNEKFVLCNVSRNGQFYVASDEPYDGPQTHVLK